MASNIYWCPFCNLKQLYKSKGNLNNHVMRHHEPQKLYYCNGCNESWTTTIKHSRHLGKSDCSGTQLETRHHESKKSLYACGLCIQAFDDFGLRQDHLFIHQQNGMQKHSWSRDIVMRSLLSYATIADRWGVAVQRKSSSSSDLSMIPQWELCWDWSNPKAGEALEALEYMRFDNQEDLDRLLDMVISTLTLASEQQPQDAGGYDEQLNSDTATDFGAISEEDFVNLLRQLANNT